MAQTITGISKTKILTNLDTYNHTTLNSGTYTMSLAVNEHPVSGITIAMKRNGSTILTTAAPTSQNSASVTGAGSGPLTAAAQSELGQQVVQASISVNCTAGDVLTVVIASATAHDSKSNDFKGILSIRQGSV